MKFNILTIFPDFFQSPLNTSLIAKAREKGLIEFNIIDIRDYTLDKHHKVDDEPYGGGPGMVMMAEPIYRAVKHIKEAAPDTHVLLTAPRGKKLNPDTAQRLCKKRDLTIICGRYEGIDERVSELVVDEEISLGDFVLFGGETVALAIIEAVSRFIPGIVGKMQSVLSESFQDSELVEYPQFTRPAEFMGHKVPDVLLSGNHKEIEKWRKAKAKEYTKRWQKLNED